MQKLPIFLEKIKGFRTVYGANGDTAFSKKSSNINGFRAHEQQNNLYYPDFKVTKKYLSEHESDIILHKAAEKAFDDFGLKKLSTVKSLNEEFVRLLTEKKAAYADCHETQEQMRGL